MDNKGMFILIIALSAIAVIGTLATYLIAIFDINPWLKFWLLK